MLKRFSVLVSLSLLCLLLSGCGTQEDRGPVSVSATQGDFKVTFTSAHSVYDIDSLDPEAPLDLEVRVDYLGKQDEVDISLGIQMGNVWLYAADGTCLLEFAVPSIGTYAKIQSGQPFVEQHTGKMEYDHLGGLPAGTYTAKAYISFSLGGIEDDISLHTDGVDVAFELPFEIR